MTNRSRLYATPKPMEKAIRKLVKVVANTPTVDVCDTTLPTYVDWRGDIELYPAECTLILPPKDEVKLIHGDQHLTLTLLPYATFRMRLMRDQGGNVCGATDGDAFVLPHGVDALVRGNYLPDPARAPESYLDRLDAWHDRIFNDAAPLVVTCLLQARGHLSRDLQQLTDWWAAKFIVQDNVVVGYPSRPDPLTHFYIPRDLLPHADEAAEDQSSA